VQDTFLCALESVESTETLQSNLRFETHLDNTNCMSLHRAARLHDLRRLGGRSRGGLRFAVRLEVRGSRFQFRAALRGSRFRAWRFAVRGSFRACAHNYVVKALVHFESCSQTFVSKRARLHEHVCAIIWKVAELAAMEALAYLESRSQTFASKRQLTINCMSLHDFMSTRAQLLGNLLNSLQWRRWPIWSPAVKLSLRNASNACRCVDQHDYVSTCTQLLGNLLHLLQWRRWLIWSPSVKLSL